MKKKVNRSFRIREDLMKEMKKRNINFSEFIERMAEEYLNGAITCPCCKQLTAHKKVLKTKIL